MQHAYIGVQAQVTFKPTLPELIRFSDKHRLTTVFDYDILSLMTTFTTAQRKFLEKVRAGPLERPTGFASGVGAWDAMAMKMAALELIELSKRDSDGRVWATSTASLDAFNLEPKTIIEVLDERRREMERREQDIRISTLRRQTAIDRQNEPGYDPRYDLSNSDWVVLMLSKKQQEEEEGPDLTDEELKALHGS